MRGGKKETREEDRSRLGGASSKFLLLCARVPPRSFSPLPTNKPAPATRICRAIEWFSFECRKTKTKVITLANHIGHRQYIEPIKTRSNYMWLTQSAGKSCERVTIGFGFTSDWMKRWRESFKPIASCRKCKTNYFSTLK